MKKHPNNKIMYKKNEETLARLKEKRYFWGRKLKPHKI